MKHPAESQLALFAGGDLGLPRQWLISWHLQSCPRCAETAARFRVAREAAVGEVRTELPAEGNWDRLAEEMTGNILVGLRAGKCVAPPPERKMDWRAAVAVATASLLVVSAWVAYGPRREVLPWQPPAVSVSLTEAGLSLNQNGSVLTLLHPGEDQNALYSSAPGSLRARYVNGDTGQVTINHVFSD